MAGNPRDARLIAACTSAAAASILRERSNSSVIEVVPSVELALIVLIPSIVSNCLINGVATDAAIVSGDAPARSADTLIVGRSACGKAATGKLT
ncbi:hypothetical protein GALL_449730 [mine drainage metagenome]|uniref:Uncharacterized protein n=1 Tax=mine drainage metagenome TaxID=410659 RepID=A0A1J5PPI6_9ZZZZ